MTLIMKIKWNGMRTRRILAAARDPGGPGNGEEERLRTRRVCSPRPPEIQTAGLHPPGLAAPPVEPMTENGNRRATGGDAVELATRCLRLQADLGGCRADTVERDAFVAGYLWGFCGGVIAALEVTSPGLFMMFSRVSRNLFGERDGPRVLAHIHRVFKRSEFEDGEAAGLADAQRSVESGRAAAGLIAHLTGPADPDAA